MIKGATLQLKIRMAALAGVFAVCTAFATTPAFAQGLVIPSGSTMDVNASTLDVAGGITVEGTLETTTGTVKLTGNWTNTTGTYTSGTGALELTGTSGTQTIDSGGVGVGQDFYNFIHSGSGTAQLINNTLDVDRDFTHTAGTFDMNAQNITVENDWIGPASAGSSTFTDTANSATVTLDGGDQDFFGSTDGFFNLSKVGNDTLTFEGSSEQTIYGTLTLQGTGVGTELTLNTDDNSNPQFMMKLASGGLQSLQYLDVAHSDATGVSLVARDSVNSGNNDDAGAAPKWIFGAADIVWQGDVNTNWNNANNWDLGVVPTSTDTAVIPDVTGGGGVQPILNVDVVVANLTLQTAATVNQNGRDLTVTGTLSIASTAAFTVGGSTAATDLIVNTLDNNGNINFTGNESLTITTIDIDSGTFTVVGDSDTTETKNLVDFNFGVNNIDFFNLTINDTSATPDTYTINDGVNNELTVAGTLTITDATLDSSANTENVGIGVDLIINGAGATFTATNSSSVTMAGSATLSAGTFTAPSGGNDLTVGTNLTVSGATLNISDGDLDVNGNVVISAGTLSAPDDNRSFTIAGNFTQTAGTFTHNSGTVTFDDGTSNTVSAVDTPFYNFTKSVTSAQTLTFDSSIATGDSPTISGMLTLNGTSGNLLSINSDVDGVEAFISLQAMGTQSLQYLSVTDSNAGAKSGLMLVARSSIETDGTGTSNNTNWNFNGATITWEGDDGGAPTDWDVASNWDLGVVPSTDDTVVIPNVANDPIKTAASSTINVRDLTIDVSGSLDLNDNDLTVGAMAGEQLTVNGTLSLDGSQSLTITDIDLSATGTFVYEGDGDGSIDTYTSSLLPTYYNLTINDGGATKNIFETTQNTTVLNNLNVTAGTFDIDTDSLTMTGAFTVDGGTFDGSSGNVDANGSVVINNSGVFTAPGAGLSFTVADDWTLAAGSTFTHNSGTVVFDTTTTTTIAGDTTFNNFESTTAGKIIEFTAGSNQTIVTDFNLLGVDGSNITVKSTSDGTPWDLTLQTANMGVDYLTVQDANAETNDMYCFSCTNVSGNDNLDAAATAQWIFVTFTITAPLDGKTTDQTPTIQGTTLASSTITFTDGINIFEATSDANGAFRIEADTDTGNNPMTIALGSATVTASFNSVNISNTLDFTVAAAPTTDQQPTIVSPADGERVNGSLPTFTGKGLAGQTVTITAYSSTGTAEFQTVGTGTVDGSGNYSVTFTTALTKGTNTISVVVDGVGSNISTYTLVDPFGVVFDSSSNDEIEGATVSLFRSSDDVLANFADGDIDAADVNPQVVGADGFYSFLAASGQYYIVVEKTGYEYPSVLTSFPAGRTITTGSKGEVLTVVAAVLEIDQPLDASGDLIRIEKDANKSEATVGDIVTYTVTMESLTDQTLTGVILSDKIPPGFKYMNGRVTVDGVPIADPSGTRPVKFTIGSFTPGQTHVVKYQLVVGSGVTFGKYTNTAVAENGAGLPLSNRATETVEIVMDPIFDLGNIIGKVFFDHNENGMQDAPEYVYMDREEITEDPVPNVRIVMEDGTIITTDKYGRFHAPAILPGRHLFRLDERSLPQGAYLTTDKVVVVDVTPGLPVKVNFGVALDQGFDSEDQQFFTNKIKVEQLRGRSNPRLNVSLFGQEIVTFEETFVHDAEFRIFTNYAPFINRWELRIVDKDTKRRIASFEGTRFNIHDPIFWDGIDYKGDYIRMNRNYEYFVTIEGDNGKYDETEPIDLVFNQIEDEEALEEYNKEYDENKVKNYQRWAEREYRGNNLSIQNIRIQGETVVIDRHSADLESVRIMKDGQYFADVPIMKKRGLTAREILEGEIKAQDESIQKLEVILPDGDYQLVVQEKGADLTTLVPEDRMSADVLMRVQEDMGAPIKTYAQEIKVGEDYMFMVGMGDLKAGYNFLSGSMEPVQPNDELNQGLYYKGKAAYYLQGKVLGKYIITSSYDTDRKKKEIFRNLDPDKYYPVYGDESEIDYTATNTQGNLYLLVEWDKSSALWGNYSVGFGDTEFARYARSLYGGKIDYQSLSTTKYGDARTKVVAFRARSQQRSAHVEFLATGGSLYYMKHKDVLEGSDEVKIEVRDKVTGLVISERVMVEGADYEMDYDSGRMLFWRPVPMLVESYSIISNKLLDGNLVYVVADYEYETKDKFDEDSTGVRTRQAIGDNVIVGTTYVDETQADKNYQLRGTDVTVKFNEDAKVVAEYAETTSGEEGSFVSTDGGLSFSDLSTTDSQGGVAYGIKGDARLFNRLGVRAHYKWIDNDFSSSATTAQQGKELIGFESVYDFAERTRLTARYDIQSLVDDGNLQTQLQLGAIRTTTTMMQFIHEAERLKLTAEYKKTEVKERLDQFDSQTNTEQDLLAVRADYKLTDKLTVSAEQQVTLAGEESNQTTVGATYSPNDKVSVTVREIIGEDGTATTVGVKADMSERLSLEGQYAIATGEAGGLTGDVSSNIGTKLKLNDATTLRTSVGVASDERGLDTTSFVLGGTTKMDKDTAVDTQVLVENSRDNQATTMSLGGTSRVDEKTTSEGRLDIVDSLTDGKSTNVSLGTIRRINEELELASLRNFVTGSTEKSTENAYTLTRVKDGKKLKGSISRKYADNTDEISQSNIFGLSGDINDRWAFTGAYSRGDVQNLDGTETARDVVSFGLGYAKTDPETGDSLKSSTKLELRSDRGNEDKRQYLVYNSIEGKLTPEITLFTKIEFSQTRNLTTDNVDASYKEFVVGGAYRPIMHDRLNLMARYTYLEDKAPAGQEDKSDIEEENAHVFSAEGIYDVNEYWQMVEKIAFKVQNEKVTGFDFAKTHTWLMIHRLNYKVNADWMIGGEYRYLAQQEAQDYKQGFLVEAARNIGEYAQLGIGYNFTDFNDDLTDLNYTSQGPFVRLTGKLYDRTPEEIERSRARWLEEKISRWAWSMVEDEISRDESPILYELNDYYVMARVAHERGDLDESRKIYKDIIIAGQMMHQEAAAHIRDRIQYEEKLKEMSQKADEYLRTKQYEKAKKILQKILEDVELGVLE